MACFMAFLPSVVCYFPKFSPVKEQVLLRSIILHLQVLVARPPSIRRPCVSIRLIILIRLIRFDYAVLSLFYAGSQVHRAHNVGSLVHNVGGFSS